MLYDKEKWSALRERLSRLIDNEVRLFTDLELDEFEHLLSQSRHDTVAKVVEIRLQNGPLKGELLGQVAQDLEQIVHEALTVEKKEWIRQPDLSAWVTVRSTQNAGERI